MKRIKQFLLLLTLLITVPLYAATEQEQSQTPAPEKKIILRIGTTGDYPPLTVYNPKTKQFTGSAIQQAKRLAAFLGAEAKFIKTTWPTLSKDLQARKFDLAMGGISASPQRAHDFLLSWPIGEVGKVPLVRCEDVEKYSSLKSIDQAEVRVIENEGGTNESFAKNNLLEAQLILVKTNQQAFNALLEGTADVMITDSIEAVHRQQLTPSLCAVKPDQPLTHDERVILIPKDKSQLLTKVNAWIKKQGFDNQ